MATRINDYVIRGEIRNNQRNRVSGWIEVLHKHTSDGLETIQPNRILLSITGNLSGPLEGRTFRFEVRERDLPNPRLVLDPQFHPEQIGVMGDSVFRMVRVPLIPPAEFYEARRRGEAPPEDQRASIYLEWYSQNGRVVLELLDPKIEFEGQYADLADPEPQPLSPPEMTGPPHMTLIVRNEDGTFDVNPDVAEEEDADEQSDLFGLFPKYLEQQIRNSVAQPDREDDDESETAGAAAGIPSAGSSDKVRDWDEVIPGIDPEIKAMYEQWDEVIYGTKDEPLTWLFEEPLCLPKPEKVRDEVHAWQVLSALLAAMALRGVAFDMCPHFTAMQAYRLLIDHLLPQTGVHPNLVNSGFVSHLSSWESCPECEAEMDEEFERHYPNE